ncbi:uroporphyrinogen-III C-methyltransferase [Niameybacter sp.]|uniref:uroporphyrinogen-III C-methyltransferase n=2 Tax=Niameybacter sp. TaxID=2033640 RepID=UPI002FC5BC3B
MSGKVYLVGAGPGDFKLLTLKALDCIKEAEVLVYDRLANAEYLNLARPTAERIYVGKASSDHTMTQDEINEVLAVKAKEGKVVTRLKGGDPYVFGRGGEEGEYLLERDIPFEVVPGITSAIGGLCYAGIPITHRDYTPSFHVITGHLKDETKDRINWSALASMQGTLVFLMGLSNLNKICTHLMQNGLAASTPAAVINWATRANQKVATGTLMTIEEEVKNAGLTSPSLIVVGEVVNLRDKLNFFEKRPLFGKNIMVTRSRTQSSDLKAKLQDLGANVFEIPTIEIVPREASLIDATLNCLEDYTYVVFGSQNAVSLFFERLYAIGKDARALGNMKVVAVGSATAKSLEGYGIRPDFMPERFTQESIAELLERQLTKEDQVLMPQGSLARDILATCLEPICQVESLLMYDTVLNEGSKVLLKEILETQTLDYITFTSSSTAKNLMALLDEEQKEKLKDIKCVSIGEVTSKTMKALGLEVYKEATPFTIDGLIQCLCEA